MKSRIFSFVFLLFLLLNLIMCLWSSSSISFLPEFPKNKFNNHEAWKLRTEDHNVHVFKFEPLELTSASKCYTQSNKFNNSCVDRLFVLISLSFCLVSFIHSIVGSWMWIWTDISNNFRSFIHVCTFFLYLYLLLSQLSLFCAFFSFSISFLFFPIFPTANSWFVFNNGWHIFSLFFLAKKKDPTI